MDKAKLGAAREMLRSWFPNVFNKTASGDVSTLSLEQLVASRYSRACNLVKLEKHFEDDGSTTTLAVVLNERELLTRMDDRIKARIATIESKIARIVYPAGSSRNLRLAQTRYDDADDDGGGDGGDDDGESFEAKIMKQRLALVEIAGRNVRGSDAPPDVPAGASPPLPESFWKSLEGQAKDLLMTWPLNRYGLSYVQKIIQEPGVSRDDAARGLLGYLWPAWVTTVKNFDPAEYEPTWENVAKLLKTNAGGIVADMMKHVERQKNAPDKHVDVDDPAGGTLSAPESSKPDAALEAKELAAKRIKLIDNARQENVGPIKKILAYELPPSAEDPKHPVHEDPLRLAFNTSTKVDAIMQELFGDQAKAVLKSLREDPAVLEYFDMGPKKRKGSVGAANRLLALIG